MEDVRSASTPSSAQGANNAHTTAGFSRRGLLTAAGGTAAALLAAAPAQAAVPEQTGTPADPAHAGRVREYWIQADSFQHNLVPTGRDDMTGATYIASATTYWAIGYRAFTPNWGKPLPGSDDLGPNTGIPGPILRASVGDTIKIHFRNNDTHYQWPHSVHTHGFRYDEASDGAFIAALPDRAGTAVKPGQTYSYEFRATPDSVGTWTYHDHSAPGEIPGTSAKAGKPMDMGGVMELGAELGLFGFVVITDAHTQRADREFFVFFHDLYQDHKAVTQDFDAFNGACFLGNTPTFTARVGERVRWHFGTLGKEFHVFHVHGHRWQDTTGRFRDSQTFGPSEAFSAEWVEDNRGTWLYHCHVNDHMAGGMVGYYKVT